MTIANSDGLIGAANDLANAAQLFPLGMVTVFGNNAYTYAQATAAAIAAAGQVALTGAFGTTTGTTYTHDVAAPGVLISQYFWAKKVATPF